MNKCWFAAKTRNYNIAKAKSYLESCGIEHFVPFKDCYEERNGKRIRKVRPLALNYIFVRTDGATLNELRNNIYVPIYVIMNAEGNSPLVVPDCQMESFIRMCDLSENSFMVCNAGLKEGCKVRIVKGELAGITGELIRLKGHKRVVVRINGLFSLAVNTYLPVSFLEYID